jgi:DNA-3-methyladenine glycosylase II
MSDRQPDITELLGRDPQMATLIDRFDSVTVEPADREFQRFVVAILNQSISTAAADSIRADLFGTVDGPLTPRAVLERDHGTLADLMGAQKATYVQNAARAYENGLSADRLADRGDEAVVDRLTDITGVGQWTARMYLLFVLGREDVFPVGDLAVRRSMERLYGDDSREAMVERSRDWAPYRSYATKYLWAEYESG